MYGSYYTPPGYNPMAPLQQRLNQMEQQFPQYSQNPYQSQPAQMQASILKGRAVTSIDEAKAAMIDLDGSVFVFPDIANKRIYTKQINLDGTATLNTYSLDEKEASANTHPVTQSEMLVNREELNEVVTYLKNDIHTLKDKIDQLNREVMSNVQSYSNGISTDAKSADEQPLVQESSRNGKWKK